MRSLRSASARGARTSPSRSAHAVVHRSRKVSSEAAITAIAALSCLAVTSMQLQIGPRVLALVVLVGSVVVVGVATDLGVRLAIVALPIMGFVRRVTAGPTGYVYNDPLALLPLALLIPAVLVLPIAPKGSPARRLLHLTLLLAGTSVLAIGTGNGIASAAYGLAVAAVPLLVGLHVASGRYSQLPAYLVVAVPVSAVVVSAYAVLQWLAPPTWDLAWLTTQYDAISSIGQPEPGQFRIFSTSESPGALSLTLGPAAAILAVILISGRRTTASLKVLAACALAAVLFALNLSSVRTALFALPVALLAVMIGDRRIARPLLIPALAIAVGAVVVLPGLLASGTADAARFDLATLSQDESFQARSDLLPQFISAVTSHPLGTGPGSTQLAERLSSTSPNAGLTGNIDNGYLTRVIETGLVGTLLFLAAVLACVAPAWRRLQSHQARPSDPALLAVVVFFLFADLSGPSTSAANGLIFWIALGGLAAPAPSTPERLETDGTLIASRADRRNPSRTGTMPRSRM